jgi:hypothetical protein
MKKGGQFFKDIEIVLRKKLYLGLAVVLSVALFFVLGVSTNAIVLLPHQIDFSLHGFSFFGIQYLIVGILFLFLVPVLTSLAVTFNIFRSNDLRTNATRQEGISLVSIASSILMAGCPQCVPIALSLAGVTVTTWLSFYSGLGFVLQIATILLAGLAFYLAASKLREDCKNCKIK